MKPTRYSSQIFATTVLVLAVAVVGCTKLRSQPQETQQQLFERVRADAEAKGAKAYEKYDGVGYDKFCRNHERSKLTRRQQVEIERYLDIQCVNGRDDENGLRDETGCPGGYTAAGDCIKQKTAAQLTRERCEESVQDKAAEDGGVYWLGGKQVSFEQSVTACIEKKSGA
jgi:hypothetical protein